MMVRSMADQGSSSSLGEVAVPAAEAPAPTALPRRQWTDIPGLVRPGFASKAESAKDPVNAVNDVPPEPEEPANDPDQTDLTDLPEPTDREAQAEPSDEGDSETTALKKRLEALEAENDRLRTAGTPLGEDVPTIAELDTLHQQANAVMEWALKHMKEGIEHQGHFYSPEELANLAASAQKDLAALPAQRQQSEKVAAHYAARAAKAFPDYFGTPEKAKQTMETAFAALPELRTRHDSQILAGALVVGMKVMTGQLKTVVADGPKQAKPDAGVKKPAGKPIPVGKTGASVSQTVPSGAAQVEALRVAALKDKTPEAFARYRAAKAAAA